VDRETLLELVAQEAEETEMHYILIIQLLGPLIQVEVAVELVMLVT
jgi:hypothetical protein